MLCNVIINTGYRKSCEILADHWADEMKLENTCPDIVKTSICHFLARSLKEKHNFYFQSLMDSKSMKRSLVGSAIMWWNKLKRAIRKKLAMAASVTNILLELLFHFSGRQR